MVSLTFTQFHLEEDAGCGYDWLAVYDGPSARAAQLGRYCGTQLPGDNGTLVATRNTEVSLKDIDCHRTIIFYFYLIIFSPA